MGDARYVGRVGALAVALGIGAATVALPGVAWAEPSASSSAGGDAGTAAPTKDTNSDQDSTSTPTTSSNSDSNSDSDADADSGDDESTADDEPAPPAADDDGDDDDAESAPKKRGSSRSNRDDVAETAATASTPDDDSGTGDDDVVARESSVEDSASDVEDPSAPVAADTDDSAPPAGDDEPDEVEPAELPTSPTDVPTAVVKSLFAPQPSSPGTGEPTAPADTPLLWTLLAFARRQFGQPRTEIDKSGSEAGTTELVDPEAAAVPVPGEVTKGDPGVFTGSVSGRVTATDPDGGSLTYSGSTTTDKGRVTVLPWGSFSYTPTAAARHAAAATGATAQDKVDSFTVTVTDSSGEAVAVAVTVDVSPKNAVPTGGRATPGGASLTTGKVIIAVGAKDSDGDTLVVTVPDTDKGSLVDNGDGTFTYTPTATARENAGAPGAPASAKTDALTFTISDGHGGITTATVDVAVTPISAVISDSAPGKSAGPVIVSSNGTIYQVTYDVDPATMSPTGTRVSILDEDGKVIRTTGPIAGAPLEQTRAMRADGSLLVTTYRTSTNSTLVSVVDGQGVVKRLGSATGQPSAPMEVAPNGAIFLQTRQFPSQLGYRGDRLVRISPTGSLRTYQIGSTDGDVTIAPDGTVYLAGTSLFGTQSVLAVSAAGTPRRVTLPRSDQLNEVLIGADGRGYLTVARTSFGTTVTRVYTFTGTANTVREIAGGPVGLKAVAPDGVYQVTYDTATGKSYVSRITASTIETSDAIDGFAINTITVTPDGTVYVSVRNTATQTDSVAVVSSDGDVDTVAIPGSIVSLTRPVGGPGTGYIVDPDSDDHGYIAYTSGGATYLAVLNPDGTIDRTVTLPAGASVVNPVVYSPDGDAYQVIQYRNSGGIVTSQAVLTLVNDVVTTPQPGIPLQPNFPPIQFGPDGTAYLATVESGQNPAYHFVGFDPSGATVSTLNASGFIVPQQLDYVYSQAALAFGPDGTPYATFLGADAGVWALTASGGTQVLDLNLSQGATVDPVAFGDDGTPYVTVSEFVGGNWVTTVKTFTPLTVL